MKKFFKIYNSIIILILIVSIATPTFAASPTPTLPMASDYINRYTATISSVGDGDVAIVFTVYGTGIMSSIGASKIELQEKVAGSTTWRTIKTYLPTDYSEMLDSNVRRHSGQVTYSGTAGYSYRAYVTVYAASGGGSDSTIEPTGSVIAS